MSNLVAKAELTIGARVDEVWRALTTPQILRKYMFGATVISDWKEGSDITWKGEWHGQPYEERGKLLVVDPLHELKYEHLTSTGDSRQTHVIDILLTGLETGTSLKLTQENNASEEERLRAEKDWNARLMKLKELLEAGSVPPASTVPDAAARAA